MMASVNFWGMYCPRYTPVVMFLLEGASKSFLLLLVSWVVLGVYGRDGHSIYAHTKAEGFLVLMLTTYLIYELGLLSERNWSLRKHFGNVWNALDAVSLSLILMWALLSPSARSFDVSRGALCLSAIPLSLQILQYISLVKSFGLLVLMIRSMFVDVLMFVVVYVVCIFGFGVCFHGLFYGHAPFNSKGGTLLFLINATLGEFDFDELADIVYIGLGTTVLVLFLVLTTVLLLNLLIAQMSSTYNRIMDRSREEWSFVLVSVIFLLLCSLFSFEPCLYNHNTLSILNNGCRLPA